MLDKIDLKLEKQGYILIFMYYQIRFGIILFGQNTEALVDYREKAILIGKKCDMLLTHYDSFFFTNCCTMYKYRYIVTK